MKDLQQLRDAIDEIDGNLLDLLNERALLAQEIGRIKERNGRPVYAPERAEQLMRSLAARSTGPLGELAIRSIYREIMSASLALEKDTVIACEGTPGDRTHLAAKQQFGSCVRYSFHPSSEVLFESVLSGKADCGVIPSDKNGLEAALLDLLAGDGIHFCSQIVLSNDDGTVSTRYFVLGTSLNPPSGDDQSALLIHLEVKPNCLDSTLEPFKVAGVNVLAIHHRRSSRGGVNLFLEVDGHASAPPLQQALKELNVRGLTVKVCGSFPRFH